MKYSTKQISTAIISTVIMLMLFAMFVLFFNDSQKTKVTYIYDDINTCTWEQGVITQATEALDLNLVLVDVDLDEEEAYLANAAVNGDCVARQGDSRGFYATDLNEQYQRQ